MFSFQKQFLQPLLLLGMLTASVVAWGQDRVFPKQGAPISGSISKINANEVVIAARGKEQTLAIKDVRKITFDKEPASLDRAREMALEGKYQQAIDQLKTVQRDSLPENPLLRQDYDFFLWWSEASRSLAGTGDPTGAIKGLMALDKTNPDSHHKYSIKNLLGRLATAKKAYERAADYFGELAQSTDDVDRASGVYYLAKVRLEQGQPEEAKKQLQRLVGSAATSPEMARFKSLAAVLEARCDIELGNAEAALKALDALAMREDNTDIQLFAELNNARGAAYLKLNDTKRAAYSFLQTDLLFFTDPESHAEALFYLKRLLVGVGQPAKAADANQRLSQLYASSVWANKQP